MLESFSYSFSYTSKVVLSCHIKFVVEGNQARELEGPKLWYLDLIHVPAIHRQILSLLNENKLWNVSCLNKRRHITNCYSG